MSDVRQSKNGAWKFRQAKRDAKRQVHKSTYKTKKEKLNNEY